MAWSAVLIILLLVTGCSAGDEPDVAEARPRAVGVAPKPEPVEPEPIIIITEDRGWPRDWPTDRELRHHVALIELARAQELAAQAEAEAEARAQAQAQARVVTVAGPGIDEWPWPDLRQCESTGRWDAVSPDGRYHGAYQFLPSTWRSVAPADWADTLPSQAPPEVQHQAAVNLQARAGWGQWPACTRRLGLR